MQTLAAGWVNDTFTGTQDAGRYGASGNTITIPTSRGTAAAIVMPVPAASPSTLGSEQLIAVTAEQDGGAAQRISRHMA